MLAMAALPSRSFRSSNCIAPVVAVEVVDAGLAAMVVVADAAAVAAVGAPAVAAGRGTGTAAGGHVAQARAHPRRRS